MRWRRVARNRQLVLLVLLAALVVTQRAAPDAMVATRSLVREWVSCLSHGQPPANVLQLAEPSTRRPAAGRTAPSAPGDAFLDPRWGADLIGINGLRAAPGLPEVTVAVIDSGVDASHSALGDAVQPGLDLLNPCGDGRTDHRGHGTSVAGVIAATPGNAGGIVGAATGVRLLPVRVGTVGGQRLRWLDAAAIVWATETGADVVNVSASSRSDRPSRIEHAAIRYAVSRGIVVVASAGNVPTGTARYPAAYPEVVSVTAVGLNRALSPVTVGGKVDVAAPGDVMVVAAPGERYTRAWGTSYAVPFVSAVAARLKATDPTLTPSEIRDVLIGTARPLAVAPGRQPPSFGIVDPAAALTAVGVRARLPRPMGSRTEGSGAGGRVGSRTSADPVAPPP